MRRHVIPTVKRLWMPGQKQCSVLQPRPLNKLGKIVLGSGKAVQQRDASVKVVSRGHMMQFDFITVLGLADVVFPLPRPSSVPSKMGVVVERWELK